MTHVYAARLRQRLRIEALEDRTLMSTCHVTRVTDMGVGKGFRGDLRYCINKVNDEPGPDAIDFRPTAYGTINLTGPLPDLVSDIDIQGPGAGVVTVRRNTGGDYRVFTVATGNVIISGITAANGRSDVGGGIYTQGTLTVADVVLTQNRSTAGVGGGIYNGGSLQVINSSITSNFAQGPNAGYGGGIYNSAFGQVTITSSTLADNLATGLTSALSFQGFGGGVYNDSTLTVLDSAISGNNALAGCNSPCGASFAARGGGIYNAAILDLQDSTISDNTADATFLLQSGAGAVGGYGGGIFNAGSGEVTIASSVVADNTAHGEAPSPTMSTAAGGGIYTEGMLSIDDTTISGNLLDAKSGYANASALGAGIANSGTLNISRSTLSENSGMACVYDAGNSKPFGGGIYQSGGTATIINSSIVSNEITAIYTYPDEFFLTEARGGGVFGDAGLTILHSTIVQNQILPDLPGDVRGGGVSGANIVMHNSIVAGNAGAPNVDLDGALTSSGFNLIGISTGGSGYASSDILDVDPMLGGLADNGGPTFTLALLPGSPAIDAGDNTDAPEWDQRGPGFPRIVNGTIDIGAFEVQATGAPTAPNRLAFLVTAKLIEDE